MTNAQTEMVAGREVTGEGEREIAGGAPVGEVLGNDRVEIVGGAVAGSAEAESIVPPTILEFGESYAGVEAAAGQNELAVEAGLRVAQCVDFDDAAHFTSVFGGNAGSVDGE